MTPTAIIREAAADGVSLALSPAGTIKVAGDQATVDRWVPLLRAHKPAILAALAPPDILARDGGQYAILVEDPTDPVIAALATPAGTCEVLIPTGRYDPFAMVELVDKWNREDPLWWRVPGCAVSAIAALPKPRGYQLPSTKPYAPPARAWRALLPRYIPLSAVPGGPGRHRGGRYPSQDPARLRPVIRRGDRVGARGGPGMTIETTDTPEPAPRFERFTVTYPSGTAIEAFYAGGATLREVQVLHPLARTRPVA